jgi:PAS domain S-box-containing protein
MGQPIHDKVTKIELLNTLYESLSEHGDSLEDTFKIISKIIQGNLKSEYIDFVLLDANNREKANIYSITRKGDVQKVYTNIVGISKHSIRTKKITIEENIKESPYYTEWRKNIESEICLPIFHKRKVIGCINLEFTKSQKFDKETITTLEIISKAVGATIYTTNLHEDIKSSEKKFRNIVENMNEGLLVRDENGKIKYANPAFQEMTNITYQECIEMNFTDLFTSESTERINQEKSTKKSTKNEQHEVTIITKDKENIPAIYSATPVPEGSVGIFTSLKDINEKEKKIIELSKSEKLLAHISKSSIDAIVSLDRNLIIKTWNLGAEKMFGYDKEEALGKNLKMLLTPEKLKKGELEQVVKMILEKGFLRSFETTRLKKEGKEISVAISATKITDEKNRFMGFGIIYRDITYQKKAEKELQARFESMQNAYLELGTQRRQLDYLLETLNISVGDENFPNIDNYIINAAMMLTKANGATLRLYDKEDEFLHLKSASGVSPEWWGKAKIAFKGTIHERAFQSRQPIFIDDIQNNPSYTSPRLAAENNFRSSLVIPLYVKSHYIGNLSLYSSSRNKLHLLDNSFIANFGKQASLALYTHSIK